MSTIDPTSDREWLAISTAPKDGSEVDLRNEALNVKFSLKPWRWSHGFWVQGPRQWRPDALGPTHWRSWVENVPSATWRPDPVEPAGDPVRDGGAVEYLAHFGSASEGRSAYRIIEKPVRSCFIGDEKTIALFACGEPHKYGPMIATAMNAMYGATRVPAAPQPDPDLETAITTLLTQVGSSHEAHPGAKRDLVRAFLARHGAEARGEVGAGDDEAELTAVLQAAKQLEAGVSRMQFKAGKNSARLADQLFVQPEAGITLGNIRSLGAALHRLLARRGARAPVAGGEPVA